MKIKVISLIAVSLFLMTNLSAQKAEKASKSKAAKTEIVVFKVNMDCEGCLNKIKKELSFIKGVKDLYLNLDNQIVAIKFQPSKTDREKLKDVIKKLKHEASELESFEKLPENWK